MRIRTFGRRACGVVIAVALFLVPPLTTRTSTHSSQVSGRHVILGDGSEGGGSLDAFITSGMAEWQVPGLAIGVIADGKVLLRRTTPRPTPAIPCGPAFRPCNLSISLDGNAGGRYAVLVTARDLRRLLRSLGCVEARQRGSHLRVQCGRCVTTVPVHAGEDIGPVFFVASSAIWSPASERDG